MSSAEDCELILCQPDLHRGCSVCCGLFNLADISRENLEHFLSEGRSREEELSCHDQYVEPSDVRDAGSHICPYQGFLSSGKPGCLIHPLGRGEELRDRSLFGSRICGGFLCPAHKILSSEEKRLLIKYVRDWYLYSVAVLDPLSFRFILEHALACSCGDDVTLLVNKGLDVHAVNLQQFGGAVFHYALPEYSSGSRAYSLFSCESSRERVLPAMDSFSVTL